MGKVPQAHCLLVTGHLFSDFSVRMPSPQASLEECLTLLCGFTGKGPFTYFLLRKLSQLPEGMSFCRLEVQTHTLEVLYKMASPWVPNAFYLAQITKGLG